MRLYKVRQVFENTPLAEYKIKTDLRRLRRIHQILRFEILFQINWEYWNGCLQLVSITIRTWTLTENWHWIMSVASSRLYIFR